jgi:hypothetical protein
LSPIAHLEENAATRGIALSIADMHAAERLATVARSSRPLQSISPLIFTSTVTRPFDREMQMKQIY